MIGVSGLLPALLVSASRLRFRPVMWAHHPGGLHFVGPDVHMNCIQNIFSSLKEDTPRFRGSKN